MSDINKLELEIDGHINLVGTRASHPAKVTSPEESFDDKWLLIGEILAILTMSVVFGTLTVTLMNTTPSKNKSVSLACSTLFTHRRSVLTASNIPTETTIFATKDSERWKQINLAERRCLKGGSETVRSMKRLIVEVRMFFPKKRQRLCSLTVWLCRQRSLCRLKLLPLMRFQS